MTKSEIATSLAEAVGISKKQVNQFFEAQANLAYKQAKNNFVIPGIGKLVLSESPAREMMMRFGPKAGQMVKVPKRKKVKFRIAMPEIFDGPLPGGRAFLRQRRTCLGELWGRGPLN